jgi:hypothetical protein
VNLINLDYNIWRYIGNFVYTRRLETWLNQSAPVFFHCVRV